ncbi:DinB family protein [Ferruginibacter sp.]
MNDQQALIVKMILDSWNAHIGRTHKLFEALSDEQLQKEVSPGRNTGVYLLGHLAAVHDAMLPLLGLGERLYPQLEEVFIKNPDKSGLQKPTVKELRSYWSTVNEALAKQFAQLAPAEWLQKHTAVSEEAFKNEPHRNRLNVMLSRTSHLAGHHNQLIFLQ